LCVTEHSSIAMIAVFVTIHCTLWKVHTLL